MMTEDGFLTHLANGVVPVEAIQRIRTAVRSTGQPVDIAIRELGILPEKSIVAEMARYTGLEAFQGTLPIEDNDLLEQIGREYAMAKAIIPARFGEAGTSLVVANPFDRESLDALSFYFGHDVGLQIASRSAIEEQLAATTAADDLDLLDEAVDTDTERLLDSARDAPVVRLVHRLLQKAVDERATDIHIEPQVDTVRIRFRHDGILGAIESAPRAMHSGIVSRLKILSRLNIAERRLPQDGRLRLAIRGQDVDFRLSIMPTVHGETAVLRVLDCETVKLELETLGYDELAAAKLRSIVSRPNGIVLITGPTGSGKTTTLYALLSELNQPGVKIFTVEDPVEYRINGITQLQVDPTIGLTFAAALRSVLRQDPDIILVGEIRDRQTAEIAVQAALTGHLVLSTLHTNSAAGAFSRLRDMGVEPFLLEATVRAVVGQRLIRSTCQACAHDDQTNACKICGGSRLKGRRAAYEILDVDEPVRQAISKGLPEIELTERAKSGGMTTLRSHALSLAQNGETTLAEVLRMTDLEA